MDRTETDDGEKTIYTYTLKNVETNADGAVVMTSDLQAQLSNLMVLSVAEEFGNASSDDIAALCFGGDTSGTYSEATKMAAQYAMFKAAALQSGSAEMKADFEKMNNDLSGVTGTASVWSVLGEFGDKYMDENGEIFKYATEGNFLTDADAIVFIMGGVISVADKYNNAETLKNAELYTSDAVINDLNTYVAATALAAAGLSDEQLAALNRLTDGILICVSAKGEVITCGMAA